MSERYLATAVAVSAASAAIAVLLWRRARATTESNDDSDEARVVSALKAVQSRIKARRASHPVTLIAVSKTKPAELVAAALAAGQVDFGENYVQEVVAKAPLLPDTVRWHFIGHLQTNKVKELLRVPNLACIHSVHSLKLAQELNRRLAGRTGHALPLDVMVQVNTSGEEAKSGCTPGECHALCVRLRDSCPNLKLVGLMCIGKYSAAEGDAAADFQQLVVCRCAAAAALGVEEKSLSLSMGMSHDFETAIESGATHVRVGSTIFGARAYPKKP